MAEDTSLRESLSLNNKRAILIRSVVAAMLLGTSGMAQNTRATTTTHQHEETERIRAAQRNNEIDRAIWRELYEQHQSATSGGQRRNTLLALRRYEKSHGVRVFAWRTEQQLYEEEVAQQKQIDRDLAWGLGTKLIEFFMYRDITIGDADRVRIEKELQELESLFPADDAWSVARDSMVDDYFQIYIHFADLSGKYGEALTEYLSSARAGSYAQIHQFLNSLIANHYTPSYEREVFRSLILHLNELEALPVMRRREVVLRSFLEGESVGASRRLPKNSTYRRAL